MIAAPTCVSTWNQSRWAKLPKHQHKVTIKAIRRLKPRLSALYREEWGDRRGVEQMTMRHGFGESATLPAHVFLATACELFAVHPIQDVTLSDLHPRPSWDVSGAVEAKLSGDVPEWEQWPVVFFPDRAERQIVYYPNLRMPRDLFRRAAGYGRRMAGMLREPPPLPKKTGAPPPRPEGYGV
jgi:hypothetical protein